MNECISLTNNHLQHDDLPDDDFPVVTARSNTDNSRSLLEGLLRNLSGLKDPQSAYQERETGCQYRTVPNGNDSDQVSVSSRDRGSDESSDQYEQTFFCHDHGEVASNSSSDSEHSSDEEYQDGEFVCYWKHREIGWNDLHVDDGRYHDHVDNNDDNDANGKREGRWFQRRHRRPQNENSSEQREGRWGFGRRRPLHEDANDEPREEIVIYCVPDESTDAHHDSDDSSDDCGHVMATPIHPNEQKRPQSPLRFGRCGDNNHDRSNYGTRLANLPIIRPFLTGPRKGFQDNPTNDSEINMEEDQTSNFTTDLPSKQDREVVMQSISEGIAGVQDDTLALDADDVTSQQHPNRPPLFLRPIARLFRGPHLQQRNIKSIQEFHKLLRKEDWTLATAMLRANPLIPQTWHSVERLYGGRYDGEVLPLHAACALCPPVSFIEELATIYPEALMAKEKSFGRVPLQVACRSLAHSSVIKLLCQMEPQCVMERDSLNRVALHYLIKNYTALGDDLELGALSNAANEESSSQNSAATDDEIVEIQIIEEENRPPDDDGLTALKIMLEAELECVQIADHRLWIPLHVACSSSSRKGMTNVIKLLLDAWPKSVLCKTSKGSDVFDCVEMAGRHHPTKDLVLAILRDAKIQVQDDPSDDNSTNDAQIIEQLDFQNGDDETAIKTNSDELLIDLEYGGAEESMVQSIFDSVGALELDEDTSTAAAAEPMNGYVRSDVDVCGATAELVVEQAGVDHGDEIIERDGHIGSPDLTEQSAVTNDHSVVSGDSETEHDAGEVTDSKGSEIDCNFADSTTDGGHTRIEKLNWYA
jgi:hypothetical protein